MKRVVEGADPYRALSFRSPAGWNRWAKKDSFLTYAPPGDPSCASTKRKLCGFHEALLYGHGEEAGKRHPHASY